MRRERHKPYHGNQCKMLLNVPERIESENDFLKKIYSSIFVLKTSLINIGGRINGRQSRLKQEIQMKGFFSFS
jgi:hypothetical protein